MEKIIDFGKLFVDFLKDKVAEEKLTPHETQHRLAELSEEWELTPSAELDGRSPIQYLDGIDDPTTLIELLKKNCISDSVEGILVERIAKAPQCASLLTRLIKENDVSVTLTLTCVELLREYDVPQPIELYLKMIASDVDDEIKETMIEVLKENADLAAPFIYEILGDADMNLKTVYAEILIEAKRDERTYNLLLELFSSGDNIPLYASYMGKYGDERSASVLYRALDNCKYSDFIEIKNAIERMGGIVDEDMRDFSEDETYIKIKGSSIKS